MKNSKNTVTVKTETNKSLISPKIIRLSTYILLGLVCCLIVYFLFGRNVLNKMAENYEQHHQDIAELRHYTHSAINNNYTLWLEIDSDGHLESLSYVNNYNNTTSEQVSNSTDCASTNLTENEVDSIIMLLQKANCIGLKLGPSNVDRIWWKRPNVLDLYSYIIYDTTISTKEWNDCLKSDSHIPYRDTVVFEYGGPSFGTDAISKVVKQRFIKKHQIEK